ncbi:transglutaminase domain-containing protein [Clostridium sp.]|uniref:transglutaminase domain-containing protein n=1 Tax=Clostridium sp. TaxID=1506 RepID=UPI003F353079
MKKAIKLIISAITMVTTLNFVGCANINGNNMEQLNGVLKLNEKYIIFDGMKVEKEEIDGYESPYKDMTSTYFKYKLSEEEQTLYKSFIYAYENGYEKIRYYSSNENLKDSFSKVIQSLCSENPFFDYNYFYRFIDNNLENYYEFDMPALKQRDLDLKIEAYNKAKELISSMPEGLDEYGRVSWIYKYIVDNISYVDDLDSYMNGSPKYIYDGLVGGKTQCSGFSDTMTMMCNLAGVEALTVSGKTLEGHAWNLVKIDGEFYHCDPTGDSGIRQGLPEGYKDIWVSFLKSDEMMFSMDYYLEEEIVIDFPKATSTKYDYNNIAVSVQSINNEEDLKAMGDALLKNQNYIVVHTPNIPASENPDIVPTLDYILNYVVNNYVADRAVYIYVQGVRSPITRDIILFMKVEG